MARLTVLSQIKQMGLSHACCLIEHSLQVEVICVLACTIFLASIWAGTDLLKSPCRATRNLHSLGHIYKDLKHMQGGDRRSVVPEGFIIKKNNELNSVS